MSEQWLPVLGWEGLYEVSDHGRVRSLDRIITFPDGRNRRAPGRIIKPWLQVGGYPCVGLKHEGREWKVLVHRLVLEAFIGLRPDGLVCCHSDGDSSNNHLSNLRWDTYSENNYDLVRHGTHPQASKTHCPQGHEYTPENTRVYTGRGHMERLCRTCQREHIARWKREHRKVVTPCA